MRIFDKVVEHWIKLDVTLQLSLIPVAFLMGVILGGAF